MLSPHRTGATRTPQNLPILRAGTLQTQSHIQREGKQEEKPLGSSSQGRSVGEASSAPPGPGSPIKPAPSTQLVLWGRTQHRGASDPADPASPAAP